VIYPLYDYTHCLSDAIEGITHSLCTLEFENNRELYDWLLAAVDWPEPRPRQYEFARLNVSYTVLSKRKLLELVESGLVDGWDDPRMPTLSGLRRRGYTPSAIRTFCDRIGVTKANSTVDVALLEHTVREDLNTEAPRVLCVLRPLKLVIENWPEGKVEMLDAPYWPHDVPKEGARPLPFSRELWVERDDFAEVPAKGWHRLAPGAEVRLRYAYVVRCTGVIKDDAGEVVELRATVDPATRGGATPDGRRVAGTLHWVSAAHALPVEVRLYDRLFRGEQPDEGEYRDNLNPGSLEVLGGALAEPGLADAAPGSRFQFERQGYFYLEPEAAAAGRRVFNRIVTLKDTWAKVARRQEQPAEAAQTRRARSVAAAAEPATVTDSLAALPSAQRAEVERLRDAHGIAVEAARVLAGDAGLRLLLEQGIAAGAPARALANWLANDVLREREAIRASAGATEGAPAALPFDGAALAELLALVEAGTVSTAGGREALAELVRTGEAPRRIVERRGLAQVSDEGALQGLVTQVVEREAANAQAYRDGRSGLLGWFVGQVMKESGGRANPQLVQRLVRERLESVPEPR